MGCSKMLQNFVEKDPKSTHTNCLQHSKSSVVMQWLKEQNEIVTPTLALKSHLGLHTFTYGKSGQIADVKFKKTVFIVCVCMRFIHFLFTWDKCKITGWKFC